MVKVSVIKKSHPRHKAPSRVLAAGHPKHDASDFVFVDNQDDTCSVIGQDAGGNPVDISAVATLSVSSSDTTIVTVDPPTGMTFAMHAVGKVSVPGSPVQITAKATWNDGSIGPFTFVLPVDVISGGATGIKIVPGTPTSH